MGRFVFEMGSKILLVCVVASHRLGLFTIANKQINAETAATSRDFEEEKVAYSEAFSETTDAENVDVKETQNVTFQEERVTTSEPAVLTGQVTQPARISCMTDQKWTVDDVVGRPLVLYNGKWGSAEGLKEITTLTLPRDLVKNTYNINDIYSLFCFWRNDFTIRIQINGTRFHQGKLIVAFIPWYQLRAPEPEVLSLPFLTASPHVILDANVNDVKELLIPFSSYKSYMNSRAGSTSDTDQLGQLIVRPLNVLKKSEGASDPIDFTMWAHSPNPSFHVPTYRKVYAEGFGDLLNVGASLAEHIVPGATPILNTVKGLFGADKPIDTTPRTQFIPRVMSPLANGVGLDSAARLGIDPKSMTLSDPALDNGVQGDEMDLHFLKSIRSLFTQFEWEQTQSYGTKLTSWNLTPMRPFSVGISQKTNIPILSTGVFRSDTIGAESYNVPADVVINATVETKPIQPTMLGYISTPFCFWRGSLVFDIQVVATQFHTGRIVFSFQPQEKEIDFTDAINNPLAVLDLQEAHETTLTVPFNTLSPWLQNYDSFADSVTFDLITGQFYSLGTMCVFVQNSLAVSNNIPGNVSINVFIRGGDDFELAVPRRMPPFSDYGSNVVIDDVETRTATDISTEDAEKISRCGKAWEKDPCPAVAESSFPSQTESRSERAEETNSSILQKGEDTISTSPSATVSESFMNLHDLLKRWTPLFTLTKQLIGNQDYTKIFNLEVGLTQDQMLSRVAKQSYLIWFSKLFRFYKGSLRYRTYLTTDTDRGFFSLVHTPTDFVSGIVTRTEDANWEDYSNFAHEATLYSVAPYLDVEVPYYSKYANLLVSSKELQNRSIGSLKMFYSNFSDKTHAMHIRTFWSVGDDFKFSYVTGPPMIQEVEDHTSIKGSDWYKRLTDTVTGAVISRFVTEDLYYLQPGNEYDAKAIAYIKSLEPDRPYLYGVALAKTSDPCVFSLQGTRVYARGTFRPYLNNRWLYSPGFDINEFDTDSSPCT